MWGAWCSNRSSTSTCGRAHCTCSTSACTALFLQLKRHIPHTPKPDVVGHAMSGRNALVEILHFCGDFLQGKGACFLALWGGEVVVVHRVACTCRLFRHIARIMCFWCGNLHYDLAEVYPRVFAREGVRCTSRPVDIKDRSLYLTCCFRDLMVLTDPTVHRDTHWWCRSCGLWIRHCHGCEHGSHFDPGSDSS